MPARVNIPFYGNETYVIQAKLWRIEEGRAKKEHENYDLRKDCDEGFMHILLVLFERVGLRNQRSLVRIRPAPQSYLASETVYVETTMDFGPRETLFFGDNFLLFRAIGISSAINLKTLNSIESQLGVLPHSKPGVSCQKSIIGAKSFSVKKKCKEELVCDYQGC